MSEQRPRSSDKAIILEAASELVDNLIRDQLIDADEKDAVVEAISSFGYAGMDGYQLMRTLEDRHYLDGSAERVEALDNFSSLIYQAVDKAQKAWAKRNTMHPPFAAGTRIQFGPQAETGTIDYVYERGAHQYAVIVDGDARAVGPSNARRIVNFEDVRAI